MIVVNKDTIPPDKKFIATVGFFDGVHLGHRFLIDRMKVMGREKELATAIITFPIHPRAVLHADYQPRLLNSFKEKIEQLGTTGLDYCIVLDFSYKLSQLSAQQFISQVLFEELQVRILLTGYDHRFGKGGTEAFEQYSAYGAACGIEVIQVPAFDKGNTKVSSSEIRKLLEEGEVARAARLLTYPYQLKGNIMGGHQVGRRIGFPTANIEVAEPFKVIPALGVYAVWVLLEGKVYKGMLSIGDRPTLENGDNISIEVHIIDFTGDIYNSEITISFIQHIRENRKFSSLEKLQYQLEKDLKTVNSILKD
ncbi:MAG: bifunctional riboflavin kinase/FAD synthetase [Tannerellaceae bacterium]|nr:bifunctional riboflavin kinase/FAD synthetase [Tannerellaceae bacterium]MCD8262729.1 bifunctional riboflavin kinase/FAD synthetase [Tannerellaceae bacterium]